MQWSMRMFHLPGKRLQSRDAQRLLNSGGRPAVFRRMRRRA